MVLRYANNAIILKKDIHHWQMAQTHAYLYLLETIGQGNGMRLRVKCVCCAHIVCGFCFVNV